MFILQATAHLLTVVNRIVKGNICHKHQVSANSCKVCTCADVQNRAMIHRPDVSDSMSHISSVSAMFITSLIPLEKFSVAVCATWSSSVNTVMFFGYADFKISENNNYREINQSVRTLTVKSKSTTPRHASHRVPVAVAPWAFAAGTPAVCCGPPGSAYGSPGVSCVAGGPAPQPGAPHPAAPLLWVNPGRPLQPQSAWELTPPPRASTWASCTRPAAPWGSTVDRWRRKTVRPTCWCTKQNTFTWLNNRRGWGWAQGAGTMTLYDCNRLILEREEGVDWNSHLLAGLYPQSTSGESH